MTSTRREFIRNLGCGIIGMRVASPDYELPTTPAHLPFDAAEYMATDQHEEDHQHIAFRGRIYDADKGVTAEYNYTKTYWLGKERKRFVTMKTDRGGPVELMEYNGQNIYLLYEGMDWEATTNNEFREHYGYFGTPNYELAKASTDPEKWTYPNIGDFKYVYCDGSKPTKDIVFRESGHLFTREIDLSADKEGSRALAQRFHTTIDDQWVDLPRLTGLGGRPSIVVRAHHWHPLNASHRPTPEDWGVIETYWYMAGHGLLRWQWLEHKKGSDPLTLRYEMTLNTPIFEFGDGRVKHLDRCQQYKPITGQTAITDEGERIMAAAKGQREALERLSDRANL